MVVLFEILRRNSIEEEMMAAGYLDLELGWVFVQPWVAMVMVGVGGSGGGWPVDKVASHF
ncbi:hypothetical protein Hanom_Chr08g00715091 [Helianthus anomalus]